MFKSVEPTAPNLAREPDAVMNRSTSSSSPRPIRVLLMTYTLGRGGAEQSIVNLVPALIKLGIEVEVVSLDPPYDLAQSIESLGVKVHRLKLRHRWNLPQNVKTVISLVKSGNFDILQCYDFYASLYGTLARRWLGKCSVVVSFQGLEFDRDEVRSPWQRARRGLRIHLLKRHADRGIAISKAVSDHYRKHLDRTDLQIIYNPFPPRIFEWGSNANREALITRFGLKPSDFVIVMVGRLIPEKAHDIVIQAIRKLKDLGHPIQILCFGKGPLESQVRALIQSNGLEKQVHIFDPLPHEELFKIVGAADLFIQPSISEGFGQAIGEAMALGRPVVATHVGGIPELVESGVSGILIAPNDVHALVASIEDLIRHPEKRKVLAEAAKTRMKTVFSAERIAEKWLALYRELISSRD